MITESRAASWAVTGPRERASALFWHGSLRRDTKSLKSDFLKMIANFVFPSFLEAQPQPRGLFCRRA